ncbi:hypothetical protein [Blautia producta]|uniref:hypothetical protein n=1 Tax=Blautia producta TaxID=33035 RepID=UPI003565A952
MDSRNERESKASGGRNEGDHIPGTVKLPLPTVITNTENKLAQAILKIYSESGLNVAVFDCILGKVLVQIKDIRAAESAGIIAELAELIENQTARLKKEGEENGESADNQG